MNDIISRFERPLTLLFFNIVYFTLNILEDANNHSVCETWNTTYWRGVSLNGGTFSSLPSGMPPPLPPRHNNLGAPPLYVEEMNFSAHEGVVYSECARIWNPIHSDLATALASGLDGPILHGTATMARAVSILVRKYGNDDPRRVW